MIRNICLLLLLTSGVLCACDFPAMRIFKLGGNEIGFSIREYNAGGTGFRLWFSPTGKTWFPRSEMPRVDVTYRSKSTWLSIWEREIEKRKRLHDLALGDAIPFKTKIKYSEIWGRTIRIRITGYDKIFFQLRRMKPGRERDPHCLDVLPDFTSLRIDDIKSELEPLWEGFQIINIPINEDVFPEYWVSSYEEFLEIFD